MVYFCKSPEHILSDASHFLKKQLSSETERFMENICFPSKPVFLSGNEIHTQNPLIQNCKLHLTYAGIYLHKVGVHRFKTLCKHSVLTNPMELPASFLFIHDIWEWGIFASVASVIRNLNYCFLPYLLVIFLLSSVVNSSSITVALMIARALVPRPHCQFDILWVE